MAKGQLRGNKEAEKTKEVKQVVVTVSSFITPSKTGFAGQDKKGE